MQRRLLPDRHGDQVRATFDLVAPLVDEATEKRIGDNAGISRRVRSRAVFPMIGVRLRQDDIDSANLHSTRPTATMPGTSTSTMATRTTGTRTTSSGLVPSADYKDIACQADLSLERWKSIDGFPEYEVSDFGRVRRGTRLKSLRPDKKGYLKVTLWHKQKASTRLVNKLVAVAFLGPKPNGQVARHLDGINTHNHFSNLAWGTCVENESDKTLHGTRRAVERHPRAKLTNDRVIEIRQRYRPRCPKNGARALGSEFGVSYSTIVHIVRRDIWKDLP